MGTLDARLRHVLQWRAGQPGAPTAGLPVLPLDERVGRRPGPGGGTVDVLVHSTGTAWKDELGPKAELLSAAAEETSGPGLPQVHTGRVALDDLEALAAHASVERVEAARPLFSELNISRAEIRAGRPMDRAGEPPGGGRGTLVAILDSGIDYRHPNFRHRDGSSRILFLWDQNAEPVPGGAAVPYGAEYTKEDLDRALATTDALALVGHEDQGVGHGTHVAGIAAGNEDDLGGEYSGIAPDAGLIVVALAADPAGISLGRSTHLADAADYAVRRASGQPVAINISQGMNGGGHAGETLLEQKLDDLARRPGVAVVKSAGNERQWNIHARGRLGKAGETATLEMTVRAADREDDIVEIWYDGEDRISVGVEPPHGPASPYTAPGEQRLFSTDFGNQVTIDSEADAAGTGDTCVTVIFTRSSAPGIEPGDWRIVLRADEVAGGWYDAWIERAPRDAVHAGEQSRFTAGTADPSRTVTIPGTAARVITVGSYVTRPQRLFDVEGLGRLSEFSGHGPTRLGARKPDLVAPGEVIVSARCHNSTLPAGADALHAGLSGTSMAAPHATGVAALVLAARPELTGEQVKQVLANAARSDGFVPGTPDDTWGAGKLDAAAAVAAARSAVFPVFGGILADGTGGLSWNTDVPSTWTLRYHTVRGRLAVGKALGTLESQGSAGLDHHADLSALPPGDYLCELVSTGPNGYWTRADDGGRFYTVTVGAPDGRSPETGSATGPGQVEEPRPADDLERIKGIGPKTAALLHEAGVITFAAIAAKSPAELASLVTVTGIGAERIARQDWVGQATQLAATAVPPEAVAPRVRHSFTLTLTGASTSGEVLGCEISHHQTEDGTVLRGWDLDGLSAFVAERTGLRLAPPVPGDQTRR
ncbi:DUF4332 domain-containing protein [Streptomyces sp. HUAS ZL42]|uniref:DUF4332 domain-containing protein n=1 Tax=Streptomyces sp. HUAS ZL42 TaxID=3231715 RepID=UPI00345EE657